MSVYTYILISAIIFILIIFVLVAMLLGVKAKLLPSGPVKILINDEKEIEVDSGSTLLSTLGNNKVFLPSACGGGGTCVQCKCIINDGGGEILPTEVPHFSRKEIKDGWEYLVDDQGNEVKDSLGNSIKVDRYKKITCELFEFTQHKATQVLGSVRYHNLNTQQLLQSFPIASEYVFEHRYATYNGDKRALNNSYLNLIRMRAVPFPSNEQMIFDTGEDLKRKIKAIIRSNKFRS